MTSLRHSNNYLTPTGSKETTVTFKMAIFIGETGGRCRTRKRHPGLFTDGVSAVAELHGNWSVFCW